LLLPKLWLHPKLRVTDEVGSLIESVAHMLLLLTEQGLVDLTLLQLQFALTVLFEKGINGFEGRRGFEVSWDGLPPLTSLLHASGYV
jgi:hypothetical protein